MTIVVVDDEISALTTFLVNVVNETKVDYKFFQNNPKECLSYVETNEVVGAFLDINMPRMDGLDDGSTRSASSRRFRRLV